MTNQQKQIFAALDAYKAAVYAKDVDAFCAIYADDVRVFDMWGEWSYEGLAAWRKMAEGWFDSLGDERVAVEFSDAQINISGDIAVVNAFVSFSGVSAQGEKLRTMHNRITSALRHTNGQWKIFHEHSSSPADFETAKVMLKR